MKKILVMMTTYNGEKYVEEQIESILNQENIDVSLFIRDDGSSDGTVRILEQYEKGHMEKVKICIDEHYGINAGVFRMYELVQREYDIREFDYYSLSDQDDVWLSDKLGTAVEKIEALPTDKPRLYLSNLRVTDAELNERFNVYDAEKFVCAPQYALADARASANTFLFDIKTFNLMINAKHHEEFYEDVWTYIRIMYMGYVYYDDEPHILFRRMGTNSSGDRDQGIKLWIARFKRLPSALSNDGHMFHQMANALIDEFSDFITNDNLNRIALVAKYKDSLFNRVHLLFSRKMSAYSRGKDICYRLRIVFGLL